MKPVRPAFLLRDRRPPRSRGERRAGTFEDLVFWALLAARVAIGAACALALLAALAAAGYDWLTHR